MKAPGFKCDNQDHPAGGGAGAGGAGGEQPAEEMKKESCGVIPPAAE